MKAIFNREIFPRVGLPRNRIGYAYRESESGMHIGKSYRVGLPRNRIGKANREIFPGKLYRENF